MELQSFEHQNVRDLAWLLCSPGLLSGSGRGSRCVSDAWCQQTFLDSLPWLQHLDEQGSLNDLISQRQPYRIGHYAEDLIAAWLAHWPDCIRLQRNISVHDGQRTIGEFDILWLDRRDRCLHHWELATKFYLRSEKSTNPACWIGPNPDDHLDRKLDVLWQRQLALSTTAAGRKVIAQHFSNYQRIHAQALVKGYLYYPCDEWPYCEPIPRGLSADHACGWWSHATSCDSIPNDHRDSRWVQIPKPEWLSPVIRERGATDIQSRGELITVIHKHFHQRTNALHIAELKPGLDGRWHERSRGFVVHDHWPQPAPRTPSTSYT